MVVPLPAFKLISFLLCPYVQRARITLLHKAVSHDIEYIDLDMPPDWFYDISPLEKVPVLLVDDKPLFESMVICEYINEVTPDNLYSEDPFVRAQQRAWIEFGNTILNHVYSFMQAEQEPSFKRHKAAVIDLLDTLEEVVEPAPLFAGEQLNMVDIVYAPIFRYLSGIEQVAGIQFYDDTPKIAAWAKQLLGTPVVQQAVPENYFAEFEKYLKRPGTILNTVIENK